MFLIGLILSNDSDDFLPDGKFSLQNLRISNKSPLISLLCSNTELFKENSFNFPIFDPKKLVDLTIFFILHCRT